MMQDNPFAKYRQPQQPANPFASYVVGTPSPAIAQDRAFKVEDQQMQRDNAARADRAEARAERREAVSLERERLALERDRRGPSGSNPALAKQENERRVRSAGLDALSQQIDRVQELYERDFANQGIATPLEYLPLLPSNERFASAGYGLSDQALAAFRVPGIGAQSDRELASFVGANQPRPGDSDAAIQEKLSNLRRRVDAQRSALGLPAYSWRGQPAPIAPGAQPAQTEGGRRTGVSEAGLSGLVDAAIAGEERVDEFGNRYVVDANGQRVNLDRITAEIDPSGRQLTEAQIEARLAEVDRQMEAERSGNTVDALARGAADTLTLGFADEIAAAGNTLFNGGTMRENLARERAVDRADNQVNFGARLTGQIAGGFGLPVGAANTASGLARVGAAYGGAYGFGSADGDLGQRLGGAATGAAIGGAAGYGLARLGQAASARLGGGGGGGGPAGTNRAVVEAAERQGVELVRPDVQPGRRSAYGFLESLPFSGGRVRADLQRGADQIEGRVSTIGGGGAASPRDSVGELVRAGAQRYIDRSRTAVSRLYDRAATLAGDAQIAPRRALDALDASISELSQTPNANRSALDALQQLRGDLVDENGALRTLSVQAGRDLRTAIRGELASKGLRFTDLERRALQAVDALNQDIASQLQGPALRAFQRADRAYRERAQLIDNVFERFIGSERGGRIGDDTVSRLSGQRIVSNIENAAAPRSGNERALQQLIQRLEPAERQEVATLVASQLGRRGQDGDNAFSPAVFFSDLQKYSPEARAAIFGRQGAADLADLSRIAEARAGTLARLNNSRSGQVGNWMEALKGVLTGGGAGAVVGGATGLGMGVGSGAGLALAPVAAGGLFLSARALGNREVVRTLASAARANTPTARQAVLNRLGAIAAREPALAQEMTGIATALRGSSLSAAASENPNDRRQ